MDKVVKLDVEKLKSVGCLLYDDCASCPYYTTESKDCPLS